MTRKVLALIGSPRKGRTYKVVSQFEEKLRELGDIDFQYVMVKDLELKTCRGCELCLKKGEEFCPLQDDRENIFNRMMQADGVIMASPVYSLQVTAILKNLLDRLAYIFHRPCFFHKTFMAIVTQGVYGQQSTVRYLNEVAKFWGFRICPGIGLTVSWDHAPEEERQKNAAEIARAAGDFYRMMEAHSDPVPSFRDILIFRSVRGIHSLGAGLESDAAYFRQQGWLESDYFYPTRVSWPKRLLGIWAERQARKQGAKIVQERERDRISN